MSENNITTIETRSLPEWLTETPEIQKTEFFLMVKEADGSWGQNVEVTDEEYAWLKTRLAERRGLKVHEGALRQ